MLYVFLIIFKYNSAIFLPGPNGLGNFFDQGWQMSLSDNTTDPDNEAIRKGVLCRMRLPETDTKYDPARNGQAFKYFMPWLSGDGGSYSILPF